MKEISLNSRTKSSESVREQTDYDKQMAIHRREKVISLLRPIPNSDRIDV